MLLLSNWVTIAVEMFTFIFFGTLSNTASAIQRRFIQEDCVYLTGIETV